MAGLIETLTDRNTLIAGFAAIAATAAVFTALEPVFHRDKLKERLKGVTEHREKLRQANREAMKKNQPAQLRVTSKALGKEIVQQLRLFEVFDAESARKKLAMAGFRGQGPVVTFMFARIVAPFILLAAAAFYLYAVNPTALDDFTKLLAMVGAFCAGFFLPNVYLSNAMQGRQGKIKLAFPDALDLLLICVESGMSIEAALQKVSEEIGGTSVELAEELALTTAELSYLQERRQAYVNLGERTGQDGIKAIVTALIQSEKYGTPLGQSLRVIADETREMRMQEAEKKAAALPPKLTVPMILFFLPVLFAVILSPAALRIMDLQH